MQYLSITINRVSKSLRKSKHFLKLTPGNQKDYTAMRGRRGKKLPRGFQNVNKIKIIPMAEINSG